MRRGRRITPVPKIDGANTRELPLYDASLIVYKKPRKMDEETFSEFLNAAARDILARFGVSRVVVGVSHWDELRLFTREQLREIGLVWKDDVFLLKDEVDLSQYDEDHIRAIIEAYVTPEPGPTVPDVRITAQAQALAEELGVDWMSLSGTGKDGRVLKSDVTAANG